MLLVGLMASASELDIKDVLNGVKNGGNGSSTTEKLAGLAGALLSSDKISIESLHGSWAYKAPAVTFKSDNLLKKAGGAAVSETIEGKLASYYSKLGFTQMTLVINEDNTFEMKIRKMTLKGTITEVTDKNSKANFVFSFKAAGKVSIGKLDTYVQKSALGTLSIMFDVSKLISLVEKVSTLTNLSSAKTLSSALSSYDGMCAGFEMSKTK
mgnify:FL=1